MLQSNVVSPISDPPIYAIYLKIYFFKGGFGTNSKRSDGTLRSNTVDVLPGPGHYEIRTDMKTNKPSESAFGTSCFTSMSNRMQNSLKAQVKIPPILVAILVAALKTV